MQSLSHEFLVLSRQLGQAQQRCSAALAAQAAQVEALQSEVMRLRAAVVVRDTRLAMANEALDALKAAAPGLPRRGALARQVAAMAERIAALSRERLRWMPTAARSAPASDAGVPQAMAPALRAATGDHAGARVLPADPGLAAASLVICQTGCISHDDYWRVQDHCRRTGKECVLVAHSLTALQDQVLGSLVPAPAPHVLSDTDQPVHRLARADTGAAGDH
ncbi:DUF2325 domain-containing protein [Acidovorax sp. RAC01]|uniref:DUF2325 domain-containing protein n=1 Tax=Acidovorax sp. RAC01 TaxID=1842533 RepID=UPI00083E8F75|nr:DUF2325 domain-containing protein [Acidovorax sp. RAC01]AOG22512.1 hypothetical protein BSY15_153 [Acidovorax sp. RAC01]